MSAISASRAKRTSSSSPRRPPTSWRRWRAVTPTISRPRSCSRPTAPVLVAPAMNPAMWAHPATRRNVAMLRSPRHPLHRSECRRNGRSRRGGGRAHGGAGRDRRGGRRHSPPGSRKTRRPPRARHVGADARTDRPGALPRQPVVGQAGPRHRRGGGGGRCPRDAGLRPGDHSRSAGRCRRSMSRPRATCWKRSRQPFPPISPSWRRRSPTGGRPSRRTARSRRTAAARVPPLALTENPDILATIGRHHTLRPSAGDRLCRGNLEPHRERREEARRQGCRLDHRQRRVAGDRGDGRRPEHACGWSAPEASRTGRPAEGGGRPPDHRPGRRDAFARDGRA